MKRTLPIAMACLILAGCGDPDDGIREYTVKRDPGLGAGKPKAKPKPKHRMLAAIIPAGGKIWYFKITGRDGHVNAFTKQFVNFIGSVDFKDGKPTWKKPDTWRKLPDDDPRNNRGDAFRERHATLLVDPDDDSLDLAVTTLPDPGGDRTEYMLLNINRWRKQLSLPPRKAEDLYDKEGSSDPSKTDEVLQRKINGRDAILAQFVGTLQPRRPGMGPFSQR